MLICSLKGAFVFVCLLALCHKVGPFVMSRAPLACPAGVHLVFVRTHTPPPPQNICKLNNAASCGCGGVADVRVRPSNPLTLCLGSRGPKQ